MPPTVRANRARYCLAADDLTIFGVPFIILHHGDREREHDPRRSQVCVDFDLSGSVAFAQLIEDGVNVWPQPLVGLPGDPPSDDEISSNPPEVFGHTQ